VTGTIEVSWFGALCDDDYDQLGVVRDDLLSSWEHCADIVGRVDELGFDNVLLPSGYQLGIDTVAFASAIAPRIRNSRLLVAVRVGEMWVPQLARQLTTLNRILDGRLTVNIISSEMPGETLDGPARYRRTAETMDALRTLMNGEHLSIDGEFLHFDIDPPRIAAGHTSPPFYFGGLSTEARDAAAHGADVYLMWPDTTDEIRRTIDDVSARAAAAGRSLSFGYRVHVVVRETSQQAYAAAAHLIAAVDEEEGNRIRSRSLDSQSAGVRRQAELRGSSSGDGFVEPVLWTGIGKARSGCGAALVGSPAEVTEKILQYRELGLSAFIFSGYPHIDEAERFAEWVLPNLPHRPLRAG